MHTCKIINISSFVFRYAIFDKISSTIEQLLTKKEKEKQNRTAQILQIVDIKSENEMTKNTLSQKYVITPQYSLIDVNNQHLLTEIKGPFRNIWHQKSIWLGYCAGAICFSFACRTAPASSAMLFFLVATCILDKEKASVWNWLW